MTMISGGVRSWWRARAVVAAALLGVVAALPGCGVFSRTRGSPQGSEGDASAQEQRLFTHLSKFYCAQQRWPTSWQELATFSAEPAQSDADLSYFGAARLSSSRAIITTLEYRTPQQSARRVSFIAPPFCEERPAADTVSVAGGRVTFQLPVGFSVLGGEGVQERWKRPPYPDAAWEDPVSAVVLALRFGEAEIPAAGVAALKGKLESAYEKSVTNITWLTRKSRKSNGLALLLHEYESDSVRGRLVTVGLSFAFDGRLLTVNIVGPQAQRATVESVAEQIHASLVLR
jgi:hypothetical protein